MAKMTKWSGSLLLSALVLATAAPGHAAPPAPGTPTAKASPAKASPEPQPRPEPQVVHRATSASPHKDTVAKKAPPHQAPRRVARPASPRRNPAQIARNRAIDSREEWTAFDEWRSTFRREYRTPGGPADRSAPAPMVAGSSPACDDACRYHQQYREWFERYSAWYDRYGRSYDTAPGRMADVAPPSYRPAPPRRSYPIGDIRRDQSARDRQNPWHGYNAHDGLENGY